MRIHEILTEVPYMVPQKQYAPVESDALRTLKNASSRPDAYRTEYEEGDTRIASRRDDELVLFIGDLAVGMMHLTNAHAGEQLDRETWQVMNVYVLPEHRNKKLGLMMYQHVLHHRKEAFAAGAAMTPSSRRVYDSLWKDPTVDVYALHVDNEGEYKKLDLKIGPDGVTTGDRQIDKESLFVAIAK